ncbi:MAG: hypothetical protein J0L88_05870, partial [Xanthomonadales bacterium]|nr:hypothetical protein [Xanthomonadales bacterium]
MEGQSKARVGRWLGWSVGLAVIVVASLWFAPRLRDAPSAAVGAGAADPVAEMSGEDDAFDLGAPASSARTRAAHASASPPVEAPRAL